MSHMITPKFDVWLEVGREGRCFTYKDGLELGVEVGDIVLVRLRGRKLQGLVIEKHCTPNIKKIKEPSFDSKSSLLSDIELLVEKSVVDEEWRDWLEVIARNYYVSPFRMLKAALPQGWLGSFKGKRNAPKKKWWIELAQYSQVESKVTSRQQQLKEQLIAAGGGSWQNVLEAKKFSSGLIKSFVSKGFAFREKRLWLDDSTENVKERITPIDQLEDPQSLTNEQKSALSDYETLRSGSALLLWGVTGSGKTEVYLHAAARELTEGRHCLILTPEIGLVPQLVDRFRRRFGINVVEYHSNCSSKEKMSTWRKALDSSRPHVFVGTRSAVFLPISNLGLVVLDEEHDSSYKQESPMPCYHARDIALHRAKRVGAKVIMGTATPSLFVWKELSPRGSLKVSRLENRIYNRQLPAVKVVDMREELALGNRRLISRQLKNEFLKLKETGNQAIVLVPRRGYSSFLSCRSCGDVVQCPNCDVALTVHRSEPNHEWLRCHWCDFRSQIKDNCNQCGSSAFKPFGAGTQKVFDCLAQELEGFRLLRFDRDTTSGRDGHRRLLEQFSLGEADVLIGTQMLAKGMDLPKVTLAVVLAADGLLHRPDLFAGEQALQLFMQLAGRAGRGKYPGKVLVQTYCPNHPVIRHLIDGCYEEFLAVEAQLRMEAGLVPYRRACLLRFAGECSWLTASAATNVAKQIKDACNSQGWELIGPAPSLVARVSGKSRWQLLLHGPQLSPIPIPYGPILWDSLPRGITLSIDPDPMQL